MLRRKFISNISIGIGAMLIPIPGITQHEYIPTDLLEHMKYLVKKHNIDKFIYKLPSVSIPGLCYSRFPIELRNNKLFIFGGVDLDKMYASKSGPECINTLYQQFIQSYKLDLDSIPETINVQDIIDEGYIYDWKASMVTKLPTYSNGDKYYVFHPNGERTHHIK